MDEPIQFQHLEKNLTLPACIAMSVSPVLKEILSTRSLSNAHIPEDCPLEQLEAFVDMCSLNFGDIASRTCSYAHLHTHPMTMANALPLIHKYDAEGLKELCYSVIIDHPAVCSIVAYDSLYEDVPWPEATLEFLVTNTMCKSTQFKLKQRFIDPAPFIDPALKCLKSCTLFRLLAIANKQAATTTNVNCTGEQWMVVHIK